MSINIFMFLIYKFPKPKFQMNPFPDFRGGPHCLNTNLDY